MAYKHEHHGRGDLVTGLAISVGPDGVAIQFGPDDDACTIFMPEPAFWEFLSALNHAGLAIIKHNEAEAENEKARRN